MNSRNANAFDETAHTFAGGLVGVLARPRAASIDARAVILMNAGLVHRVGPFRGYVQLARALAERGYTVLRFDQSGLGDSPVSSAPSAERRQTELRAAMRLVTSETGIRRFVIGGICSAADDAFNVVLDLEGIEGLLLIDGLAYRTPGFWMRYLPPRVLNPRKLWGFLRKRGSSAPGMADFRDFPSRDVATERMSKIVARDIRVLFLFTGGAYRYFNHTGQLAACLGRAAHAQQITLQYWRDCDHTFFLHRDRLRLQDAVGAWLQKAFA